MAESIRVSTVFPVSPERLYRAWLDSAEHTAFTGTSSTVEPTVGGRHNTGDGYIEGEILELEPHRRIVQSWRSTDFPEGAPASRLEIHLEATDGGTRMTLHHSEIPDGQGRMYEEGWEEYYFQPMARYFGAEAAGGEGGGGFDMGDGGGEIEEEDIVGERDTAEELAEAVEEAAEAAVEVAREAQQVADAVAEAMADEIEGGREQAPRKPAAKKPVKKAAAAKKPVKKAAAAKKPAAKKPVKKAAAAKKPAAKKPVKKAAAKKPAAKKPVKKAAAKKPVKKAAAKKAAAKKPAKKKR